VARARNRASATPRTPTRRAPRPTPGS
jgi:hypothetical protein